VRKIQIIDGSEYIDDNIRELIGKCGYLVCFRHEDMGGNPVFSATVEIDGRITEEVPPSCLLMIDPPEEKAMSARMQIAMHLAAAQWTMTSSDSNFLNPDYRQSSGELIGEKIANASFKMADYLIAAEKREACN
jgi:hypothetical protein